MPTATPFKTFPKCFTLQRNVTIGQQGVVDYVTLGGHRGSTNGSTATQASIDASYDAANKLYFNFHGIKVDITHSASASASCTATQSFRFVSNIDEEGNKTYGNSQISASTSSSSSSSYSSPTYTLSSNQPNTRICFDTTNYTDFTDDKVGDTNQDNDSSFYSAYSDTTSVRSSSSTSAFLEGFAVGPPDDISFFVRSPVIVKFYDSGNFVGYGLQGSLIFSALASGSRATAISTTPYPNIGEVAYSGVSNVYAVDSVVSTDLGGISVQVRDEDLFTENGISLFFMAGHTRDEGSVSVSGKNSTSSHSESEGPVSTSYNLFDLTYIDNRQGTVTSTASAEMSIDLDIDLQFYTY
jgi:hypothetical protein